jgi:hypothetical protein
VHLAEVRHDQLARPQVAGREEASLRVGRVLGIGDGRYAD